MIYFHAYVSQKEFLRAYKIAPKCPKFAADDLFSRACILKEILMAIFTNFAATLELFLC